MWTNKSDLTKVTSKIVGLFQILFSGTAHPIPFACNSYKRFKELINYLEQITLCKLTTA